MASEYLKHKYRNVVPEEKRELTPQEKRQNWWHYHKRPLILGAVLAAVLIDILVTMSGITRVKPDVQVALIASDPVPEAVSEAVQTAFEQIAGDYNKDGKTVVQINSYYLDEAPSGSEAAYSSYASEVTLVSDFEECESYFFLTDDPDRLQKSFEILANRDGTLPDDFTSADNCILAWKDIPLLRDPVSADPELSAARDYLSAFCLAHRGFWTSRRSANETECRALWDLLAEAEKGGER